MQDGQRPAARSPMARSRNRLRISLDTRKQPGRARKVEAGSSAVTLGAGPQPAVSPPRRRHSWAAIPSRVAIEPDAPSALAPIVGRVHKVDRTPRRRGPAARRPAISRPVGARWRAPRRGHAPSLLAPRRSVESRRRDCGHKRGGSILARQFDLEVESRRAGPSASPTHYFSRHRPEWVYPLQHSSTDASGANRAARSSWSMLPCVALAACGTAILAGCAAQKPIAWERFDGQPSSPAVEQHRAVAIASCRAYAINAGNQVQAPPPTPQANVNVTNNLYVNPPSGPLPAPYQPPQVDFSALGDIGAGIGASLRRQETERSNMAACMAQQGYRSTPLL
jgi:hypothetical protein